MRAVVQRVESAAVTVGDETVGRVDAGLCVLLGVTHDDDSVVATRMAEKLWGLRIFDDDDGVMNCSVADTTGAILLISQFTLYGDTRRGRRPGWSAAAGPDHARPLIETVATELARLGASVATGRFGADMRVELVNDGPVTVIVDL